MNLMKLIESFLLIILFAVIVLMQNGQALESNFTIDDYHRIGRKYEHVRMVQHIILHVIALPLFGQNYIGYRCICLLFHTLNGFLISQLFVLLFETFNIRTISRFYVRSGAVLTGIIFLTFSSGAPSYISALSYLVLDFFSLCTLIFTLLFLQKGKFPFWIAALSAFLISLYSNRFATALPVIIFLLEISSKHGRRNCMTLRYMLLAGVMLFSPLTYGDFRTFFSQEMDHEIFPQILDIPWYLSIAIVAFWGKYLSGIPLSASIAGLVILCLATGYYIKLTIRHRNTGGLFKVIAIYFIIWNGLIYMMSISLHPFWSLWRYYYNSIGLSVTAGVLLVFLLSNGVKFFHIPRFLLLLLTLIVLHKALMLGHPKYINGYYNLSKLLMGTYELPHPDLWTSDDICQDLEHPTREDIEVLLLTSTDLTCMNLRNVNISGLDLNSVDFSGSNLIATDLISCSLKNAVFSGACLMWADLTEADLSGAILENVVLSGAIVKGADFRGAIFRRTKLCGVEFGEANLGTLFILDDVDLSYTSLTGVDLGGRDLTDTKLRGAVMRQAGLNGVKLVGTDLTGVDMFEASLVGADLHKANLQGAILTHANLTNANLSDSDLEYATLRGADLSGTNLMNANLRNADLRGAMTINAQFEGADLRDALLDRPISEIP